MFKKDKKTWVSMVLFFAILVSTFGAPSAAKEDADSGGDYAKNETVYVNLTGDGSVAEINVVNSFTNVNGQITDFGQYESIVNLTNSQEPVIDGDKITFATGDHAQYYYQGTLSDKKIPWDFNLAYELDGKAIEPSLLSGANGALKIALDIELDEEAAPFYQDHYMLQISFPFDMERVRGINAPDATKVVVGKQAMLTFTLLPGEAGSFVIEANVADFAMDAIEITAINSSMSLDGIDNEISSGFGRLSSGFKEMIAGTGSLKDGLTELNGGINQLHRGAVELGAGKDAIIAAMAEYRGGLSAFTAGLPDLRHGSNRFNEGLSEGFEGVEELALAYDEIEDGLAGLLENKELLEPLATGLMQSPDPSTRMLAEAMLGLLGGTKQLHGGMKQANTGFAAYATGMGMMAEEYAALNKGLGDLAGAGNHLLDGYDELYDGASLAFGGLDELKMGTGQLKQETAVIPTEVQKLIDGQKEMENGIDEARVTLDQFTTMAEKSDPVSFVAPEQVVPETVQFIIRTPEIEQVSKSTVSEDGVDDGLSFWQRLLNLFSR